jgi:penicillin-binding protein 1C
MAQGRLAAAGSVLAVGVGRAALDALDRAFPPPLEAHGERSVEVVDRDGNLLRAYAIADGRWRLAADLSEIDPGFPRHADRL